MCSNNKLVCMRSFFIKFILNIFLIIPIVSFTQNSGYWLQKKGIPDYTETDQLGIKRTDISFTLNDTIYVGSITSLSQYIRDKDSYIKKTGLSGISNIITSFAIGNKGYVLARLATQISRIFEYNPINDQWTAKQTFTGTNANAAANFIINGKAYIIGGSVTAPNPAYISNYNSSTQIREYNPLTNAFNKKADPPINDVFRLNNTPTFNSTTAFAIDNLGYVLFNEDEFYQYDPITNNWYKKTSPFNVAGSIGTNCSGSSATGYFKSFGFNNNGYAIYTIKEFYGSYCNQRLKSKFLKYSDINDTWQLLNSGCISGNSCPVSTDGYGRGTNAYEFGSFTQNSEYLFFTTSSVSPTGSSPYGELVEWSSLDFVIESTNLSTQSGTCINYGEDANLNLKFSSYGNFVNGNNFKLLLSDQNGSFANPTVLSQITTGTTNSYNGEFNFILNSSILDSTKSFKIKVQSTNPLINDQRTFDIKDSMRTKYGPVHNLSYINNNICSGSYRDLNADVNGTQFVWYKNNILQNGVNGKTFSISQPGNYFCKITLSNGCFANSDTIQLVSVTSH